MIRTDFKIQVETAYDINKPRSSFSKYAFVILRPE